MYRFSNLAGRVIKDAQGTLGLGKALKPAAEPLPLIYAFTTASDKRPQAVQSTPATGQKIPYAPMDPELLKQYAKFQAPDGVPVHLKGGPIDKILYFFSILACVVGTPYLLWQFRGFVWPHLRVEPKRRT